MPKTRETVSGHLPGPPLLQNKEQNMQCCNGGFTVNAQGSALQKKQNSGKYPESNLAFGNALEVYSDQFCIK